MGHTVPTHPCPPNIFCEWQAFPPTPHCAWGCLTFQIHRASLVLEGEAAQGTVGRGGEKFTTRRKCLVCINEANRTHAVLPTCSTIVYHTPCTVQCPKYTNIHSSKCLLLPARPELHHPHSDPHALTRASSLMPWPSRLASLVRFMGLREKMSPKPPTVAELNVQVECDT